MSTQEKKIENAAILYDEHKLGGILGGDPNMIWELLWDVEWTQAQIEEWINKTDWLQGEDDEEKNEDRAEHLRYGIDHPARAARAKLLNMKAPSQPADSKETVEELLRLAEWDNEQVLYWCNGILKTNDEKERQKWKDQWLRFATNFGEPSAQMTDNQD